MKHIITILCSLLVFPVFAQKHDFMWVIGSNNQFADTAQGGGIVDFNFNPVKSYDKKRNFNLYTGNASICDTAGRLLFYSNGCDIIGANDTILENGENINPGPIHQEQCGKWWYYPSGEQSIIILPVADTVGLYYVVHRRISLVASPQVDAFTDRLYYSLVDMSLNNGSGKVVQKNTVIMADTFSWGLGAAIKHANQKDWWVVCPRRNESQWYVFLFTKEGVKDTVYTEIGEDFPLLGEASTELAPSPDGTKLALYNNNFEQYDIHIFDFDRETGILSNDRGVTVDYQTEVPIYGGGCGFSPNSRYLYITPVFGLYQYDTEAADISASQQLVGVWDGVADPFATAFWQIQLGPDCKMYIKTAQDSRYYHVIHNPDKQGTDCDLEQRGLVLSTWHGASMPYFPNFRLGPPENPGVPCKSTVSVESPMNPILPAFSVFPNPADDWVKIVTNRAFGPKVRLTLFNSVGQRVLEKELAAGQDETAVKVDRLSGGLYFYEIKSEKSLLQTGRIIVR